jgi:hypothetical protein
MPRLPPTAIQGALALFPAFCGLSQLHACRYSVRDVAFADLGGSEYRLIAAVRGDTPAEMVDALRRAAASVFSDTNVRFEIAERDGSFPAFILHSPDGRQIELRLGAAGASEKAWSAALEEVVSTPFREELLDGAIEAHSAVLVIEGDEAELNREAREVAAAAIEEIGRRLSELPKPIASPPRLIVLPQRERARERVLLWSLDLEDAAREPRIAVLFGRARKLGGALTGPGRARSELAARLAVVGQDCECGLDRSWMQGIMLPHRWGSRQATRAAELLGFSPESPLVKAEISRILAKGSAAASSRSPRLGPGDPFLGYSELEIDEAGASAAAEPLFSLPASLPRPATEREHETEPAAASPLLPAAAAFAAVTLIALAGGAAILWRSRRRS